MGLALECGFELGEGEEVRCEMLRIWEFRNLVHCLPIFCVVLVYRRILGEFFLFSFSLMVLGRREGRGTVI